MYRHLYSAAVLKRATNSLKSLSLPTTIFLIISFLLLTMAELFSVSLLKNAGGWELLEGERDPILTEGRQERRSERFTWCVTV